MIPTFNYVLFYFTALFSLNTGFVSKDADIEIDLNKKTVQIEFYDLKTSEKDSELVKADLIKIEKLTEFDDFYPEFALISKNIYKKGKKLNAKLKFSYNNPKDLDHLYFHTDSISNLLYPILSDEKVISSNGKLFKSKEVDWIQWNKNKKVIKLSAKRLKISKDETSLLKYF